MNVYNEAADVYSYAIVLWELATRQKPFEDMNVLQVAHRVLSGVRLDIPADVPADFAKLISDCWAQDPRERPTATEALSRLEAMEAALSS